MPLLFDPTGDPPSPWGVVCSLIFKENIMPLNKISTIGRRSSLDRLCQIREKLAAALLRGALEGTNAWACLRLVEREIARRELATLFKD